MLHYCYILVKMVIKTKRNQELVEEVFQRDLGLCRCCGFKGDEVHHIVPLVYGGKDEASNMVTLCSFCHKYAPDTKEEFIDYVNRGGAKYEILLGMFINRCDINGLEFHKCLLIFKKILFALKKLDYLNAIKTYNLKEIFEKDIDDINLDIKREVKNAKITTS